MAENHIDVCYICEDYSIPMGISLLSLLENRGKEDLLRIFLIDVGMSVDDLHKIQGICNKEGVELSIFHPYSIVDKIKKEVYKTTAEKNCIAMSMRLFLGYILPDDLERVVCLDCDTLVTNSLSKYFSLNFQEPIAAVIDANFDFNFTMRKGYEKGNYFNAGILLINLKQYRDIMTYSNIMSLLKRKPLFVDQDVLNTLFKNNYYKIPPRYNASINYRLLNSTRLIRWMKWDQSPYSIHELDEARLHPVMIHFTSSALGRPWESNNLDPDRMLWRKFYKKSPWKGMLLKVQRDSLQKRLAKKIYQYCPQDLFMAVEYIYRKVNFLKNDFKKES